MTVTEKEVRLEIQGRRNVERLVWDVKGGRGTSLRFLAGVSRE